MRIQPVSTAITLMLAAATVQATGEPKRLERLDESLDHKQAKQAETDSVPAWYRHLDIEITGLIEVEASDRSAYEGDSESDIRLATAELGIRSQLKDWVEAGISFLYEQDETDLEVDTAYLTLANPDVSPLFLTAGQVYVPFGVYETNLVSDPLTLEIGETRETALQLGFEHSGLSGGVYVFNGDNKVKGKDRIQGWGANLGFVQEGDDWAWSVGTGYINDLGDSDSLHEIINDNRVGAAEVDPSLSIDPTERTAGWTLNATASFGPFSLIGEYLSASDAFDPISLDFKGEGARPSAWNIEAGYSFTLLGAESMVAAGYQGTREALALELPKERWLLGWSTEIFDRTSLGLEWARDHDYNTRAGGTGESGNTFTAQLAVEF
ncbi:LbtU family siderophore porin [Thermochromatium tepidum]|uniref:LbtU family siderophore porin n=1 Tax=Thermochromatium tepidum ATCC 43061 TaxID=316276 RepID=A0A6I6DXV7_THETI|nr:LbtU family siderophore porin [Thermochromatium tepidum]QGU31595.1 LbtU family siderophore porin [Thermochromatium tepidum ATCC 43061]